MEDTILTKLKEQIMFLTEKETEVMNALNTLEQHVEEVEAKEDVVVQEMTDVKRSVRTFQSFREECEEGDTPRYTSRGSNGEDFEAKHQQMAQEISVPNEFLASSPRDGLMRRLNL